MIDRVYKLWEVKRVLFYNSVSRRITHYNVLLNIDMCEQMLRCWQPWTNSPELFRLNVYYLEPHDKKIWYFGHVAGCIYMKAVKMTHSLQHSGYLLYRRLMMYFGIKKNPDVYAFGLYLNFKGAFSKCAMYKVSCFINHSCNRYGR